jgi:CoA:oxalate CoA-transferase
MNMPFPLEGIRVLDLSQAISGPYAARILGDLGADVVKVEWPRGDVSNAFGKRVNGRSGLFTQMNVNKRGVGIDLAKADGAGLVRKLAAKADVVIENFRPGVADRGGISYSQLAKVNPGLVMLSISGFGRNSPEAGRAAYAPVIHAEAGLLARQATLDGREPADFALALADTFAALHGAIAVLAALALRSSTRNGQHIDLGMLQAMLASDDYIHDTIDDFDELYPPRGDIWPAVGGPIMIAADHRTLWSRVSSHADLSDPARPDADREEKIDARRRVVGSWIRGFTSRERLIAELERADLAWADVRTAATLLDSPTLKEADLIAYVDNHCGGVRGVVRMPYLFSDAACDVRRGAPARCQHNREVLTEWLDLDADEILELERCGALTRAEPPP